MEEVIRSSDAVRRETALVTSRGWHQFHPYSESRFPRQRWGSIFQVAVTVFPAFAGVPGTAATLASSNPDGRTQPHSEPTQPVHRSLPPVRAGVGVGRGGKRLGGLDVAAHKATDSSCRSMFAQQATRAPRFPFPVLPCWSSPCPVPISMGMHFLRSVAALRGQRPFSGADFPSTSASLVTSIAVSGTSVSVSRRRDIQHTAKGGDCSCFFGRSAVHESVACGSQEGWLPATLCRPSGSECFRAIPTLQDGKHPLGSRSVESGRLYGQTWSERCVFPHPRITVSSGHTVLPMGKSDVPVSVHAFWPGICPAGIYKGAQTSLLSTLLYKHPLGVEASRHADHGTLAIRLPKRPGHSYPLVLGSGADNKLEEVSHTADANNGVSGFPGVLHSNEFESSESHDGQTDHVMSDSIASPAAFGLRGHQPCGPDAGNHPSRNSYSPALQSFAALQNTGAAMVRQLRRPGTASGGSPGESGVVDIASSRVEWPQPVATSNHSLYSVRRIPLWLGRRVQWLHSLWSLVSRGTTAPHQLVGVKGRLAGTSGIHQGSQRSHGASPSRQYFGSGIRKSSRWHPVVDLDQLARQVWGLVHPEPGGGPCITPARSLQSRSTRNVSSASGVRGLAAGPNDVSGPATPASVPHHRSVCGQTQNTAAPVCVLVSRSRRYGDRRNATLLEQGGRLCFPSVFHVVSSSGQGLTGPCTTSAAGGAPLARPGMVLRSIAAGDSVATPTALQERPPAGPFRQPTSADDTPVAPALRMVHLRRALSTQGFLCDALQLFEASWRGSTERAYQSAWLLWVRWCSERQIDHAAPCVASVCNFLANQYRAGRNYCITTNFRAWKISYKAKNRPFVQYLFSYNYFCMKDCVHHTCIIVAQTSVNTNFSTVLIFVQTDRWTKSYEKSV